MCSWRALCKMSEMISKWVYKVAPLHRLLSLLLPQSCNSKTRLSINSFPLITSLKWQLDFIGPDSRLTLVPISRGVLMKVSLYCGFHYMYIVQVYILWFLLPESDAVLWWGCILHPWGVAESSSPLPGPLPPSGDSGWDVRDGLRLSPRQWQLGRVYWYSQNTLHVHAFNF